MKRRRRRKKKKKKKKTKRIKANNDEWNYFLFDFFLIIQFNHFLLL